MPLLPGNVSPRLPRRDRNPGSLQSCLSKKVPSVSAAAQSCPTLCGHEPQHARPPCPSPTPGVYSNSCPSSWWCHPTMSSSVAPSPPAPSPSQHQGLFWWVSSLHEVVKILEFQLQRQSFQWTPRTDLLQDGLVGSPCSPRDSRVFSSTTVQKHQFFISQLSL